MIDGLIYLRDIHKIGQSRSEISPFCRVPLLPDGMGIIAKSQTLDVVVHGWQSEYRPKYKFGWRLENVTRRSIFAMPVVGETSASERQRQPQPEPLPLAPTGPALAVFAGVPLTGGAPGTSSCRHP
jgi:hypothetical protein